MDGPLYERSGKTSEHVGTWPRLEATGYSAVQRFFLMRLERLIRLSRTFQSTSTSVDGAEGAKWRRNLLDRALYSTYRDCVSVGLGDEARSALAALRERTDRVSAK